MGAPETSVVIRAFNEAKHLPGLFAGLARQRYRDFEVIVVDSGSLDRTREIAAGHCQKLLRIDPHDFTFGYSLNAGIRAASGWYIAIVSAHTAPVDEEWLARLVAPLRDPRTAMVYGRQMGVETSRFGEIQDFRRTFDAQPRVVRPPKFFANNANSAVRRDLWEQHAFDESLPGLEDIEWAKYWMERGCQVVYEPRAAIYHIHEESWRQVRRRYYREAVAARQIGLKGPYHAVSEVAREGMHLLADFGRVAAEALTTPRVRDLGSRVREIFLFRFNKAAGTVLGLRDRTAMGDARRRERLYYDRSYRAAVVHGPGRASLDERELPELKPGDVLIRVAYVGVCATDLEVLDGKLGYYKHGMAKYPIVPGHEFSGRVVVMGANVSHVGEGDPVVAECIQSCGRCPECRRSNWIGCPERAELGVIGRDGAYAEYVIVPGHFVHRVPADLDLRKAALCEPLAVVLKGLRRLSGVWRASPERRVAVVGAGPLGHLCARVLSARGCEVTAFDRNPARLGYFEGSGVAVSNQLAELSKFDAVVEATGDPSALHTVLHESTANTTILLLGLPYAHREFNFETLVAYDKTVVGSVGSTAADFQDAIRLLPALDLDGHLRQVLPLERFEDAWAFCRTRRHLKVLLSVAP